MLFFAIILLMNSVCGRPPSLIERLTETKLLDENGGKKMPRYDDELEVLNFSGEEILTNSVESFFPKEEVKLSNQSYTATIIPFTTNFLEKENDKKASDSKPFKNTNFKPNNIDPLSNNDTKPLNETRNIRGNGVNGTNPNVEITGTNKTSTAEFDEEFESQEDGSSSEEDGNMFTGLISAFLGGLSKPDGGIDVEAIVGLLGSLSTQNPDGTYNFDGLTELLRSFFGGDGGSDVGAFTAGILGAVIKGFAPNAKQAGVFVGKIANGVLPALSAPPEGPEGVPTRKPPPLDSGSFLTGLLKTILGSNGDMGQGGKGSKYTLFKLLFSLISGLLSTASSLSSKSDWTNQY